MLATPSLSLGTEIRGWLELNHGTKDCARSVSGLQESSAGDVGFFYTCCNVTTPVAAQLIKFTGIRSGENVLDVGTGTGVVAITAARNGARVTGLDLTPALLEQARANSRIARMEDIVWTEGDAESLPFPDASFDAVLSQFGHMFAPRPEVAVAEIRRVLKSGAASVLLHGHPSIWWAACLHS